ncbi:MAG: FkbM family methyltransferase, partial [Nitrososphaerales archaeon]
MYLLSCRGRSKKKGLKRIFYDDGDWIHETSDGYFAYHKPISGLDMVRIDELAKLHFFWGYQPKSGDVVMDVGAGVGEEALTFSREVGLIGKVVCVEAHPATYRRLEKLVKYNHLENIIAIHRAVTEPSCFVTTIR